MARVYDARHSAFEKAGDGVPSARLPTLRVRAREHTQNPSVHHINRPSVRCGPSKLGWAAICVQDFDAPCVLQFAWISALCCALHRSTSQVIHRSGSFLKIIFIFFFPFCGKPRNEEKYIYSSNHGCGEESVCESTERAGLFNAVCRVRSVRGAGRRRVFQHTHIPGRRALNLR